MSIAQRADGRWVVRYKDVKNHKWMQKAFRDEQTARAWHAEYMAAWGDREETRLTLGELVTLYFRSNPDKHFKTRKNIVYFLAGHDESGKHISGVGEFLRDKYAESLTRQDLERVRDGFRARGTGNNTINKYQAYIHAILAWGVDQALIRINPWRDYKRLKVTRPIFRTTIEDLTRLYSELPEYLQWAVKTAFFLALRPGQAELFSLTWDAFNWRRGLVIIRQGKSGLLKTVIPHPAYLSEAKERYDRDMADGIPLVCHRAGRRVLSYTTAWRLACKRSGVQMRPYDIRHIAATEMLARGADLAAVAAQLGHSNVATTGGTYAHVTAGSQARAASLMPGLDQDPRVQKP